MKKLKLSDNGLISTQISVEDDQLILQDVMTAKGVQNILDQNKAASNNRMHNPHSQGRLAASIPTPMYYAWKKEWRDKHQDKWSWKTFLVSRINSPEFKFLRTQESTIGLTSQDRL